jgi:hypothetical protein
MNTYSIFYEHRILGYYVTDIEGESILSALEDFTTNWAYKQIYGIMVKHTHQ